MENDDDIGKTNENKETDEESIRESPDKPIDASPDESPPDGVGGRFSNIFSEYARIIKIKNVWIMGLSLFLLITFVSSWLFLLPLFLRNLGALKEEIGTAYLFFVLAFSVFQIPGGYIADKIGRKKIIAYPTLILPPIYIAAGLVDNWVIVMAFLTLGNLIQGIQIPALYSLMAESVDEDDRGLGFSILEISLALGFTAGPLMGFFILRNPGMLEEIVGKYLPGGNPIQLMMIMTGIILIPCALLRLFGLKDSAKHEDFKVNIGQVLKAFDSNLILLLISFIFYGLMVDMTFYGPFIPLYAKDYIKISESSIQMMFALGGFFAVFFNIISGKLTKMMGSRKAMIVGVLGHSLLFIPWLFAGNLFEAAALYIPTYIFLQLSYISHDTIMSDLTDIRTRSTVIGVFFMVPGIIASFSPQIGAQMSNYFGPATPFVIAIIFAVLTVVYLLMIKSDRI
ncbi:MAG: MFS transporter [Candidatus Eremiobacteraeota bacterium]|nr:MFS transporter [Candidatus Eremiobacteraeota bacterium]